MNEKTLENLRSRTDAKLRYAAIYLEELRKLEPVGGSDVERAHQESFLFHLLGAKDAYLQELNIYFSLGIEGNQVQIRTLREALKRNRIICIELNEIETLQQAKLKWLYCAIQMRNYSTHISYVPRAYHLGGVKDHQVWMRIPDTNLAIERHFVDEFDDWLSNMTSLLDRLRSSAIISSGFVPDTSQQS